MTDLGEIGTRIQGTELLALLLKATQDGIVFIDLDTGETQYSPRWQNLLGFEGDALSYIGPPQDVWRLLVHPADLPEMDAQLGDHVDNGWPFSTTVRMAHQAGGFRHMLCRGASHRAEGSRQLLLAFSDITDRVRLEERQAAIARALPDTMLVFAPDGTIVAAMLGIERPGSPFRGLNNGAALPAFLKETPLDRFLQGPVRSGSLAPMLPAFELVTKCETGNLYHEVRVFHCAGQEVLCIARDVTERRALESRLIQAQKLESVGHLAAGIAHEINTPMQFIGDNLHFVGSALSELGPYVSLLQRLLNQAPETPLTAVDVKEAAKAAVDADVDYSLTTLPDVVARSLAGVERVTKIVQAIKAFSHPGGVEFAPVALDVLLRDVATVATSEWKYVAEVNIDIDPEMPPVECVAGELNQVVLNLIINASHAIGDAVGSSGNKGQIGLRARLVGERAEIAISDTGTGIPEHVRTKVFDPFFTTKEVGKGTGQGLALAYSCVVERHKGTLRFETEMGKGTTFFIQLPLRQAGAAA